MDICVLNPFFYPYKGGTERVLFQVYSRLAKRNDVTVITSGGRKTEEERLAGMRVIRLGSSAFNIPAAPMPFVIFHGLADQLKRGNFDIFHINNRYQYFAGSLQSMQRLGKIALTIHNSLPVGIGPVTDGLGTLYDMAWGRSVMRRADLITGVSKSAVKTTVPADCLGKSHVVYNGVDYRTFRRRGGADHGVKKAIGELDLEPGTNIITNGRLIAQKGQRYLMEAFCTLSRSHDVNLTIIGNGPLKERLVRYARKRGLESRLRIVYGLDSEGVSCYYNASDIFVLPSLYEPFGLAAYEALSCEMPVITTRVGGLPEIIKDCGFYVRERNSTDIVNKVLHVMGNGKEAAKMAGRGRERVKRDCDWDRIAGKYEALFSGL